MDKRISGNQINNKKFIMQSSSINNDNNSNYKTSQPIINAKIMNDIKNTAFDYKNIPVTLTGEISSPWIHRDKLTRNYNNSFTENDIEDDDEQFFLNLKEIIDKNQQEDRKNNSIKDLQSKSYSSRKKKSLFSNEDENVMKRFKKCVEEKKSSCTEISGQELQKNLENQIPSVNNNKNNRSATPSIDVFEISPTIINSDINLRMQKNDKLLTPENTKIVKELTTAELINYYQYPDFTPCTSTK